MLLRKIRTSEKFSGRKTRKIKTTEKFPAFQTLKLSDNELRFLLERLFEIKNISACQNSLPKYIPTYPSPVSLKTTNCVPGAAQVRHSCAAYAALVRHRCDAE